MNTCPNCKGRGFYFSDILAGSTKKCECQKPKGLYQLVEKAENILNADPDGQIISVHAYDEHCACHNCVAVRGQLTKGLNFGKCAPKPPSS